MTIHAIEKRLAVAEAAAANLVVDDDAEPSPIGIPRGEYMARWIEWAGTQSHVSEDQIAVVTDALEYEVQHRPVLRSIPIITEILEEHHAVVTSQIKQASAPQISATH
ncbi:MAG: hypothetical protein ABGZ53_22645 [Fuerstiella sp.]